MSTAVLTRPAVPRTGVHARPGLKRLTLVELRKMTDTRAGFWLLLVTAAVTALVTGLAVIVAPDQELVLVDVLALATVPPSLLLPVVGILLVTSEWSQRTAMITFALVPQRSRVMTAKLLAGFVLAAIAFGTCVLVALIATAAAGDGPTWRLSAGMIGQAAFSVVVPILAGVGFGAVLLASAPAIVSYFLLPTVWAALGTIPALRGAAGWLDQSTTTALMLEGTLSLEQWARVGTSVALWVALPIVLGSWRVARSDVR